MGQTSSGSEAWKKAVARAVRAPFVTLARPTDDLEAELLRLLSGKSIPHPLTGEPLTDAM